MHVVRRSLFPVPLARRLAAVPCKVWPLASGEVQPVGHDLAVLALPMPNPLKAVPIAGALSVHSERVAWAPPLLQSALPLGLGGSPTSHASLCMVEVCEEMLALPVVVGSDRAWEVDWSIGAQPGRKSVH